MKAQRFVRPRELRRSKSATAEGAEPRFEQLLLRCSGISPKLVCAFFWVENVVMYLNGPLTRTQKQRKTNGTFPGSGIDRSLHGMFRKFVASRKQSSVPL